MKKEFYSRLEQVFRSCGIEDSYCPETAVVLGSGLSELKDSYSGREIAFSDIDGFPSVNIKGHPGLIKLTEKSVLIAGRIHYYEGHSIEDVILPVALLWKMGVKKIILTNAAGGVNKTFNPGDLALITDHINLTGVNPLIGRNEGFSGDRFPDMSTVYSKSVIEKAQSIDPDLKKGVYAGMTGPSYETPAEIRMLESMGADMVGMSTVNEAIAAKYFGMDVTGISCITNMAAGILDQPLNHSEVIETGKKVTTRFIKLVSSLLEEI